jgi:hypothetical protein
MIQICARPVIGSNIINKERLYSIELKVGEMKYKPLLLVRASTGAEAERKLAFCFEHELKGKTLSFNINDIKRKEQQNEA